MHQSWGLAPFAALLVVFSAPAAPPTTSPCVVDGSAVTLTAPPESDTAGLSTLNGEVTLFWDAGSCAFPASSVTSLTLSDVDASVQTWEINFTQPLDAIILVANDPTDAASVRATALDDHWTTSGPDAISTDADEFAEMYWAETPELTTFYTGSGNDVLDLQGASPWTGATKIFVQSETSVIDAGDGPDSVQMYRNTVLRTHKGADQVTTNDWTDNVDTGEGDDLVTTGYSGLDVIEGGPGTDTLAIKVASTYDPTTPNGDGVQQNQHWGVFEVVVGSAGIDHVVAPPEGIHYDTGGGSDFFTSGLGNDIVTGYLGETSFAALPQVIAAESIYEPTPEGTIQRHVVTASNGSVDQFEYPGDVIGSPGDDHLTIDAVTYRPGQGDDLVGIPGGHTYIIAEPEPDGADQAVEDSPVTFDYSLRESAVRLSLNGKADDGAPGEGDLVRGDLIGGRGDDVLIGSPLRDHIEGGPGDDRIVGHEGGDQVWANEGNDTIIDDVVGLGTSPLVDSYLGGPGDDSVDYSERTRRVWAMISYGELPGEPAESDSIKSDIERVIGTPFGDTLLGSRGDDVLLGRDGRDTIKGSDGADHLYGGAGNDDLFARDTFKDRIDGGDGADSAHVDRVDILISARAV